MLRIIAALAMERRVLHCQVTVSVSLVRTRRSTHDEIRAESLGVRLQQLGYPIGGGVDLDYFGRCSMAIESFGETIQLGLGQADRIAADIDNGCMLGFLDKGKREIQGPHGRHAAVPGKNDSPLLRRGLI